MIPTADKWLELAKLLRPGTFLWYDHPDFENMPAKEAAGILAAFHVSDHERRREAAKSHSAFQWMKAQGGYKAFVMKSEKQQVTKAHCELWATADPQACLAQCYAQWQLKKFQRDLIQLWAGWDSLAVRRDRVIAQAMAEALRDDWPERLRGLRAAQKAVQKAQEALAGLQSPEAIKAEAFLASVGAESADGKIDRLLKSKEQQLAHDIAATAKRKTKTGQAHIFLDSLLTGLRADDCGVPAGLRRLVEMMNPDSEVSEDTIRRVIKNARRRAVRRMANRTAA